MAQPLTWRDVAAPDFSGAQRGQAQAAAMLNAALTTAGTGLAQFDNTQSDIVNQEAQRQLLKYQDPAELQAALKSGALFAGLDPARIRTTTMNDANSRVSNLLSTAASTEALAQSTYNNQYTNAERLREMQARPGFAALNESNGGLPASLVGQLPVSVQGGLRTGDLTAKGSVRELRELGRTDNIRDFSLAISPRIQQMSPNALRGMLDSGQWSPEQYAVINELGAKLHGGALFGPNATVDQFDATQYRPAGSAAPVPAGQRPSAGAAWANSVGLTTNESGGKTTAENSAVGSGGKVGHFGLLQFGQARLADAKSAGVLPADMTPQQFRDSPAEVQNKVADWHFADIDKQAEKLGLNASFGKTINGVVLDRDSIRGMAHLGGIDGVKQFIETNGKYDPADVNKTKISDYGKKFGGGGVGSPAPTQAATMIATAATPRPTGTIVDQIPGYSGPLVAAPAGRSASGLIGNATAGTVNPVSTVLPPTPAEAALATPKVPALGNATAAKMFLETVKKETNYNASLLPIANDAAAFTPSAQGVPELAQELLKLPEFKGAESRQLIDQMNSLVQKDVTPRVAAAILKNSVTDEALWTGFNWLNPNSSTDNIAGAFGSKVIDEKTRDNLAKLAKGNVEIGKIQSSNEVQQGFGAAQDLKLAEITKLEADRMTQKIRADQNLPGAKERYDAMTVQYEKKLQEFQTSLTAFQKAKADIKNKK